MEFSRKERYRVGDLVALMELLRSEGGCPWDRKQTHQSIRHNFIAETYEAVEAIDNGDAGLLREELGDVLLQVVFHAQIEREAGGFDFDDVCDAVCKKLVSRHPHVFGDVAVDSAEQVLDNWDAIKNREKGRDTVADRLRSVPRPLPALMRSAEVQRRAAKAGFDYGDILMALRDLRSEADELEAALGQDDPAAVEEELGDLIFSAVNVSRFAGVEAELALTGACDKFIARFERVERLAFERGIDFKQAGIQVLDDLWKEAKNIE